MLSRSVGRLLGAVIVLAGGILLWAALVTPWYSSDVNGIGFLGEGGWSSATLYYLGIPSMVGTVQYWCSVGWACGGPTSYSSLSLNNVGAIAEIALFFVVAASALAVVAGALGMGSWRNGSRNPEVLPLAVVALNLGLVAPEFYAAALQLGLGWPWGSLWSSGITTTTGGEWTSFSGPAIGWYIAIAAAAMLLAGVVLLALYRPDPEGPVPPSAPSEGVLVPDSNAPAAPRSASRRGSTSSASPSRKARRLLWGVLAVVVVVVVAVFLALAGIAACWVRLSGQSWGIDYARPAPSYAPNYLGIPVWSSSGGLSVWIGSSFSDTITLTSTDYVQSHNITSVTVASPFSVSSVSPSLPILVSPGGTVTMNVTVKMPSSGGSYQLSGTITAK